MNTPMSPTVPRHLADGLVEAHVETGDSVSKMGWWRYGHNVRILGHKVWVR
jgi:hypothetical protein